jgi:hypothetical protein
MIIHRPHGTLVFFGHQDVGGGIGILPDAAFFRQEDGLFFDEPALFPPPRCESRTQAFLVLGETVPQPLVDNIALVNDQAEAEAAVCNASVEFRFLDLRSLDTVIRWLTELRKEFEQQLSDPKDET